VTDLFLDAVSVAGAGLVPVEEAAALGISSVLEFVGRRRRICGKVVLVVLLLAQGVHLAQLHPLGSTYPRTACSDCTCPRRPLQKQNQAQNVIFKSKYFNKNKLRKFQKLQNLNPQFLPTFLLRF